MGKVQQIKVQQINIQKRNIQQNVQRQDIQQRDVKQRDVRQRDVRRRDVRQRDVRQRDVRQQNIKQRNVRREDARQKYMRQRKQKRRKRQRRKWILGILLLLTLYISTAFFFEDRFFWKTKIYGMDVSLKKVEDVIDLMKEKTEGYVLTIHCADGTVEQIEGKSIDAVYQRDHEMEKLLKKQNVLLWPQMFFDAKSYSPPVSISYNREKLLQQIDSLFCVMNPVQTDPISAKPVFDGNKFVVETEVYGTKIDIEALKGKISSAVEMFQTDIDLLKEGCYLKPKYNSESPEVQGACDIMNQYCKASITYNMPPYTEVVDAAVISQWLICDENMNVVMQEEKAYEYMAGFAARYKTVSATRPLTTPWGKQTQVTGGTYGWSFDENAEAAALINYIKNGEVITKEPAYTQYAASHELQDWGTTYAEVDLTEQHMWYVSDGAVIFETDVVTGMPYEHSTPEGVYALISMARNALLVGNIIPETGEPEYETPVSCWMQITEDGVGFHDATWQPYFGGSLYLWNGSHGCVNMPLSGAETLFNLISPGIPVILHY